MLYRVCGKQWQFWFGFVYSNFEYLIPQSIYVYHGAYYTANNKTEMKNNRRKIHDPLCSLKQEVELLLRVLVAEAESKA